MIEYTFDTTRAATNLLFGGALERYPDIQFILPHAGGVLPYLAWRLSVAPVIDPRLPRLTREQVFSGLKRFWYDNALAPGRETMGTLQFVASPDRIVFGSDWPFANDRVMTEELKSFGAEEFLSAQQTLEIERQNALALFPRRARR
jgi:predicted TIM-barrel fold metal-dependent hydrolase